MKRTIQLALLLSLATIGYAQGDPTPYLMYTLAGGILTSAPGSGVPAPGGNPPPLLCETLVAGQLQYCSFSGSGSSLTLTTTGTSGAATYNSGTGVFNIPVYSGGGSSEGTAGQLQMVGLTAGSFQASSITDNGTTVSTPENFAVGSGGTPTQISTTALPIANLPAASTVPPVTTGSNTTHTYKQVLDGTTASDCTVGGGGNLHWCYSNGTTWIAAVPTGTVTHTVGALTANAMVVGNGAADVQAGDFYNTPASSLLHAGVSSTGLTYAAGIDGTNTGSGGVATLRGANQTGAGSYSGAVAGGALVTGGSNASSSTVSQSGSVEITPGYSTAGGEEGVTIIGQAFKQGTGSHTQWTLQCLDGTNQQTANDCGASPTSFLGVTDAHTGSSVQVHTPPSITPIVASSAVTLGHTVCAGTTAGDVTDSGGTSPCSTGITVGVVVATSGAWTFADGASTTITTTLPLVQMWRLSMVGPGDVNGTLTNNTTGTAAQAAIAASVQGVAGTLNTLTLANATSGLLTVETATGAITSYTLQLPVAQPAGANTYLSCTAANPSVCTFAAGTVTGVTGTAPVSSSGGTAPVISMHVADASDNGYLASADWSTFNGKQPALSLLPGTYVNGDLCTYTASGTLLNCNTAIPTGTVTTVSVATANGVSGSVTNATTTPAITLTLGAITPSTQSLPAFKTARCLRRRRQEQRVPWRNVLDRPDNQRERHSSNGHHIHTSHGGNGEMVLCHERLQRQCGEYGRA